MLFTSTLTSYRPAPLNGLLGKCTYVIIINLIIKSARFSLRQTLEKKEEGVTINSIRGINKRQSLKTEEQKESETDSSDEESSDDDEEDEENEGEGKPEDKSQDVSEEKSRTETMAIDDVRDEEVTVGSKCAEESGKKEGGTTEKRSDSGKAAVIKTPQERKPAVFVHVDRKEAVQVSDH